MVCLILEIRRKMDVHIIFEEWLDGISNYLQWKFWMDFVLKESRLWTLINMVVTPPTSDPISIYMHEIKEAKDVMSQV